MKRGCHKLEIKNVDLYSCAQDIVREQVEFLLRKPLRVESKMFESEYGMQLATLVTSAYEKAAG